MLEMAIDLMNKLLKFSIIQIIGMKVSIDSVIFIHVNKCGHSNDADFKNTYFHLFKTACKHTFYCSLSVVSFNLNGLCKFIAIVSDMFIGKTEIW